ncbi:CHAT domain-containing protein [Halorussus halophilus]|uniref:CHAT domain-containing protein n=1 Tax=Halorussus halophilus TaxID=2650975 RepID=UPI0013019A9F|nr:CHAT domain-containing protein [Halorussus halophilus]
MQPRFDSLNSEPGLEVVDPIENSRFVFQTDCPVSPTAADTEEFYFPVSTACEVVVEELSLPRMVWFSVREATGDYVEEVQWNDTRELEPGAYLLDFSSRIKLYVRADSALTIDADPDSARIAFDGPTRVRIGARSNHSSPGATVTVPDDPTALMDAVSTFGSALKTTSCERSWPSLRGHPPQVERGDELQIPDELEPPDTGVTIHVPPAYESIFAVAPLAYYLGATVVPGESPRITTDDGFVHRLDSKRGFEDEAIRTLKQTFLLDCVTRTEGYYQMRLKARKALEPRPEVPLDFESLYELSLAEQLREYLSVPFSAVESTVPTWNRVVHMRPDFESVELLPFVADDLSLVRVHTSEANALSPEREQKQQALESFKRSSERQTGVPGPNEYMPLPTDDDAIERAWVGEETPDRGAKLLPAAFRHEQPQPRDGTIEVTIVCNDEEMNEEFDAVSAVYGSRKHVRFDVESRFGVSTDEVRSLLAEDTDLFHFIGHIDGRGLECPDGVLDAETVSETGATTVLLNACRSHDQGVALVEAGAKAAIVSLSDVENEAAVEVGETFARLLDYGFTVGGALEVAREYTTVGRQYVVLGDPNTAATEPEGGGPFISDLEENAPWPPSRDDEIDVRSSVYCSQSFVMGSVGKTPLEPTETPTYYLVPGHVGTFTWSVRQLERIYEGNEMLYAIDGELRWSEGWPFGEAEQRQ